MLVNAGITVLLVHMICQGSHDELCHLHQKGCWFILKVVIPASISFFACSASQNKSQIRAATKVKSECEIRT